MQKLELTGAYCIEGSFLRLGAWQVSSGHSLTAMFHMRPAKDHPFSFMVGLEWQDGRHSPSLPRALTVLSGCLHHSKRFMQRLDLLLFDSCSLLLLVCAGWGGPRGKSGPSLS